MAKTKVVLELAAPVGGGGTVKSTTLVDALPNIHLQELGPSLFNAPISISMLSVVIV